MLPIHTNILVIHKKDSSFSKSLESFLKFTAGLFRIAQQLLIISHPIVSPALQLLEAYVIKGEGSDSFHLPPTLWFIPELVAIEILISLARIFIYC